MTTFEQPRSGRDLIVRRAMLLQLGDVYPDAPTRDELFASLRDSNTSYEDVSRALDDLRRDGIAAVADDGSAVRMTAVAYATMQLLDGS